MGRKSSIERLPVELRELIGELRRNGRTIDEILGKLRELDVGVSRSALGRHIQGLDEFAKAMQWSRGVSEMLVDRLGDAPENKTARLNIELLHGALMRLLRPGQDGLPVELTPKEAQLLSDAMHRLTRAARDETETELRRRKEVAQKGADAAVAVARQQGLSADTVAAIEHAVLGVAA